MKKVLSEWQSYSAMSEFLESYYWATEDDDLGSLLGSVTLWSNDGELFDQAISDDWHTFFVDVSDESHHTLFQSFQVVKQFVNEYLPDITVATPVSGNLTYAIRTICDMAEVQRNQDPIWKNWVAAVDWVTNPNVEPVNESPFLKTGQSLPNPKEKGFRKNQFPIAKVLPVPRPEIPMGPSLEKVDLTQSYYAFVKFLQHYYQVSDDSELGNFLQQNRAISENNEEYRYWKEEFSESSGNKTLLDILKVFLMIKDYFEIEFPDNARHTHPVRKLSCNLWKAAYLSHSQRVQTEVWQNWLTAVHQVME